MSEPCELSAAEARRLIGAKKLSPVELLDSCLKRIEQINPKLNAVVALAADRAREEARAAERAAAAGEELGPLHGLPLGIKDLEETAGIRTTWGSLIFKDHVPARDERGVAVLRQAGGIVVGKTNTPEFGAGGNTTNAVYGPTRNPFDLARTCGGSSGGSAVAVATGMLPLCTGSDLGGSLRTPAAFCGVVGFRPSPGLIPVESRPLGWATLSVRGPLARNVADLCLLLSVQAGYDARDPLSGAVPARHLASPPRVDLSRLRVAYSADFGGEAPVDPRIRAVFLDRIGRIKSAFKSCAARDPQFQGGNETFQVLRAQGFLAAHLEKFRQHRDKLGPNVAANVEKGLGYSALDVAEAHKRQTQIYRGFQEFFRDCDVLIAPAAPVPPFPVEKLYVDEIDGKKLPTYIHWVAITYLITLTTHPTVALPCGRDHTGTPFGIQIVGPRLGDRFTLGVAHALEQAMAGDPAAARPVPDIAGLSA